MKNHGYTVWYSPASKQDLKSTYTYIAYELRAKNNAKGRQTVSGGLGALAWDGYAEDARGSLP